MITCNHGISRYLPRKADDAAIFRRKSLESGIFPVYAPGICPVTKLPGYITEVFKCSVSKRGCYLIFDCWKRMLPQEDVTSFSQGRYHIRHETSVRDVTTYNWLENSTRIFHLISDKW